MDTLLSFIPNLPSEWIYFLFLGTNKKKFMNAVAKEDSTIVLNKYRHRTIRQIEFIIRVLILGTVLYFLNDIYLEKFLNDFSSILLKETIELSKEEFLFISFVSIFIECVISSIFYVHNFKNGLIGMDMSPNSQDKVTKPIIFINICTFVLIYIRFINVLTIFVFIIYISIVLLYCSYILTTMKKHEIFRFFSGSRFSSTDLPLLHKDIFINLKTGKNKHRHINLLENNLYICDNDDILILSKNGKKEIFQKETIKNLQIKNIFITYKNNQWTKN